MSDPLRAPTDYELFIYTLPQRFTSIRQSTLTLVRRGASLARVAGELHFDAGYRLNVRERLVFDRLPITISWYGYELWCGSTKVWWYDPQPHPDDPQLRLSFPHHKHLPPDIKHHRVSAPQMSFVRENLSSLVGEIDLLINASASAPEA